MYEVVCACMCLTCVFELTSIPTQPEDRNTLDQAADGPGFLTNPSPPGAHNAAHIQDQRKRLQSAASAGIDNNDRRWCCDAYGRLHHLH